jgi:hypothetical protein
VRWKLGSPSPAFVVACIALIVALGPAVQAANTVFSTDIVDGEVKTSDLGDAAVTLPKLAFDTVGPWSVINNSLTSLDLKGADRLASISLAASSIPKGGCVDAVAAVFGAQVNEVPLVSSRAEPPAGILLFATRVVVANQVRLKVCNSGAGVLQPFPTYPCGS